MERLGRPQDKLPPAVHVAGTNGKGSVVAFMRAILEAHGLACHVYTSPHLVRFHERIVVAGREIDDMALADVLETCEAVNAGDPITFFEITTAAAFLAFSKTPADVALIETGLGGRLDATNLIERPALTVLTPIDLDHQAFLGETLAEIAGEKAGILKSGVACLSAAQAPAGAGVIERRTTDIGVPLRREGTDWRIVPRPDGGFDYADADGVLTLPPPSLAGAHQIANAGLAVAAVRNLGMLATHGRAAIAKGLRDVRWPGRLQRLDRGRLAELAPAESELWVDGGHNPHAAEALARHLSIRQDRPWGLVVGMLNTKDAGRFIEIIGAHAMRAVCVPVPSTTEGIPPERLVEIARGHGLRATTAGDISGALRTLAGSAPLGGMRILICGSLYIAGAALAANGEPAKSFA